MPENLAGKFRTTATILFR